MPDPSITVVIASCSYSNAIQESLEAIIHSGLMIHEITVVGHFSARDITASDVKIHRMQTEDPCALIDAVNQAANRCRSDYLALIDGDTEIESTWLSTLVEFCTSEPDSGAAGGKLFLRHDKNAVGHRRETSLAPMMVDSRTADIFPAHDLVDEPREVAVLRRDALLLRGQVVRALPGLLLDPEMESPYRELDLLARIMIRGWRCFYVPEAVAWRRSPEPEDSHPFQYHYRLHRDRSVFMQRYFWWIERLRVRQKARAVFIRDLIRVPQLLIVNNPALRGRMAARFWLFRHRKRLEENCPRTTGACYSERVRWAQSMNTYYIHERPEILSLIPKGATQIVDIGCGSGGLGHSIKADRTYCEVRGVEPNPAAARRAKKVLDDVWLGRAEDSTRRDWPTADCLLFADVLEHLVDPLSVLQRWRAHLRQGGSIVVSLPNVSHWRVVWELMNGRWDYQSAGVLDRTHLRFFTRETGLELITMAGFEVIHVERRIDLPNLGYWSRWMKRNLASHLELRPDGTPATESRLRTLGADFATMQYLFVAKKS